MKENAYVDKRRHILWAWKDYLKKQKNACNSVAAVNRRLLLTESFMRIWLTARDKEIEDDMIAKVTWALWISKQSNLRHAISKWRSLVLDGVRVNWEQAQTSLIQTTLNNKNQTEHLIKLK